MYSEPNRGWRSPSRGHRPYTPNRGRGGGGGGNFGDPNAFSGHDDRFYDQTNPPYTNPRDQPPQHYQGSRPPRRGNYYTGGTGGNRPFKPRPRGGNGGRTYYDNSGGGGPNSAGFYRNDRGGYYQQQGGRYPYRQGPGWNANNDNYNNNQYQRRGGDRYPTNRGSRYRWQSRQPQRWRSGPPPYANPPNNYEQAANQDLPRGLTWCCDLEAHSGSVTCLAFDEGAGKFFSAGSDGIVRQWNSDTGMVEHSASFGGPITALLIESHYLFVAVRCTQDENGNQSVLSGDIHIYNLEANSEQKFMAHMESILALHISGDMLLSAGQDRVIKGWRFNQETKIFDSAGTLGAGQQGHQAPIQCLTTLSNFLFSGDAGGAILVWNMETGGLIQSLNSGHNGSVTSMVCWKGSLITGSLDRTIRVWSLDLAENSQAVVLTPPCYHSQTKNAGGYPSEVISLHGTPDGMNNPVLMAGLGTDEVALYELPSFTLRGRIRNVSYPVALAAAAQNCLFVGTGTGTVRVFTWEEGPADEGAMVM